MESNIMKPASLIFMSGLFLFTGCAYEATFHGLRAIQPPVQMGAMMTESNGQLEYPVVNSRGAILQWERFTPAPGEFPSSVSVTYDLRVWDAATGTPGAVIYERTGLPSPWHRIEIPIRPGSRCFWSVRARIRVNGETRLTDWSHSLHPYRPFAKEGVSGEILPEHYYRFQVRGYGDYMALSRRGLGADWR
jgi:hypothetical protein